MIETPYFRFTRDTRRFSFSRMIYLSYTFDVSIWIGIYDAHAFVRKKYQRQNAT